MPTVQKWSHGPLQRLPICDCSFCFADNASYVEQFEQILQGLQLKTARQQYSLPEDLYGANISGTNIYGILHAPRGDATEAIVLSTTWKTTDGRIDIGGVSLLMSLAGYFKRKQSLRRVLNWNKAGHCGLKISYSY